MQNPIQPKKKPTDPRELELKKTYLRLGDALRGFVHSWGKVILSQIWNGEVSQNQIANMLSYTALFKHISNLIYQQMIKIIESYTEE
jgi:hypothetical protein